MLPSLAQAQSVWGGAGATTTTTNYNLGTNWSTNPTAPVAAASSAQFGATGNTTVVITAGPITPDSWTFSATSQSYTVSGQAVNFNGAGPNIVNNANAGQTISISNNMTGSAISQAAASTLTISGTNSFTTTSVTGGTLVNSGSLTSSVTNTATYTNSGTLTGTVNSNAGTFGNSGTVTGAVTITGGSATNSGALSSTLGVTGGTFQNNAFGSVSGLTTNNGGAVTNNGGTFAGVTNTTGTFTNTTGTVSGPVSNTATFNANGGAVNGAITNGAGGTFNVGGTVSSNSTFSNSTASSRLLVNSGTYTVTGLVTNSGTNAGGGILVANGATLTATAGGITNNVGATIVNNGTVNDTLNNSGPVTNNLNYNADVSNTATGTINNTATGIWTGNLLSNLNTTAGAITNAGTWNGDANNSGAVSNSGTWTTTTTGFTNNAAGVLTQTAGTINATAGGFANAGTVNASGGAINGAITNTGAFNVTGNFAGSNTSTFTNNGTGTLAVTGGNYTGLSQVTNNSTAATGISISATRTLSAANIANSAGSTISNSGTLTATTGPITNAGPIQGLAGSTINGGLTQTSGTANLIGTINGAIINNGASFFTANGALVGNSTFTNNGTSQLAVAGGDFTGLTTVTNNSTNANGVVIATGRTLGATSLVNAAGAFVQDFGTLTATTISNAGTLNVQLAGSILNGALTNTGTVNAQGQVNGVVTNNSGGAFTLTGALAGNGSAFNNNGGATTNIGTQAYTGLGTFTNAGTTNIGGGSITATGFNNSGNLVVTSTGSTINGPLTSTGTINLLGATLGGTAALNVNGSLVMQAASSYLVQVNPTTATFTSVTGAATLNGAAVTANFTAGSYVSKRYTLLTATGGLGGSTFGGLTTTGQPSGLTSTLSYDANNAYLNLNLNLGFAVPGGLNQNQQNVANALTGFFNRTGGISGAFTALTPGQLTQSDGEVGTSPQQTTFNAMNQFMGILTDQFIAGRGNPVSAGGGAHGYADETMAYAAKRNPNDAMAAIYRKAPVAEAFAQRWSVWAAGYGGSQTTSGNAVVGSNNTTSSIYGTAVGADYRISPDTLAGFALAGGGTNFSVANNLGSGRSDLFQAGAFVRHTMGAAYLSGALAYGWQDITTNRTLTIAGVDQLRAQFNANAWSGRVEGGYRFVSQGFGWTPYAAGQFTTFDLPAYAEQVVAGANTFALAYGARSVTATRSELGLRTDKSFAADDGVFTLRGRLAWAHDYNPDRAIGATFQTLPGASFVVNGARQASDAALVTASAEKKWLNGWSAAATFEGEFSNVTTSYAGKGVVRYAW